jgi:hypothetical protein
MSVSPPGPNPCAFGTRNPPPRFTIRQGAPCSARVAQLERLLGRPSVADQVELAGVGQVVGGEPDVVVEPCEREPWCRRSPLAPRGRRPRHPELFSLVRRVDWVVGTARGRSPAAGTGRPGPRRGAEAARSPSSAGESTSITPIPWRPPIRALVRSVAAEDGMGGTAPRRAQQAEVSHRDRSTQHPRRGDPRWPARGCLHATTGSEDGLSQCRAADAFARSTRHDRIGSRTVREPTASQPSIVRCPEASMSVIMLPRVAGAIRGTVRGHGGHRSDRGARALSPLPAQTHLERR